MKVDELIKHLDNVKIDENKIDEKREIAEYLAQVFDGSVIPAINNFMMKDKTVYGFDSYVNLFRTRRISPDDAFVYVGSYYTSGTFPVDYLYPFLTDKYLLRNAYLSKLGCGPSDCSTYAPARGLKYVSMASIFTDARRVVVEVADLDTVAINTNLLTIAHNVLSTTGYMTCGDKKAAEIMSRFLSQRIFAGYDFIEAKKIMSKYYKDNDTLLITDVKAIRDAYNRIFKPYRIVYNIKTKRVIPLSVLPSKAF